MTYPEHTPDSAATTTPQHHLDEYAQLKGLVTELLYTEPDSLAVESFALGAGKAVCVSSYVSIEGYRKTDTFEREGTELIHRRPHNPMNAHADIVGLWDDTTEAALYTVSAPFQPTEEVKAPFAQTICNIIRSSRLYFLDYETIPDSPFEGITMSRRQSIDSAPPRILLTPATAIDQKRYGSLDDADGLDVRMHGPAALAIPKDQYLVVQDSRVLRGPAEDTPFPVVIDEADAFSLRLSVAKDGSVECGEAGNLVAPLPYGQNTSGTPSFTRNPQLTGPEALNWLANALPQLPDVTDEFLPKIREQLLAALPLDIEVSLNKITAMARQAVQECLAPGNEIRPRLIGSARVSEWLTKRIQDGEPRGAADLDEYLKYMASRSA